MYAKWKCQIKFKPTSRAAGRFDSRYQRYRIPSNTANLHYLRINNNIQLALEQQLNVRNYVSSLPLIKFVE